ncbi:HD domain-containing protein [Altererythrobacter sp. TH136]|uniref:HD domain-containing protein n=1 Tax=Altererythrobacter sp. TH136 TaxID=2067415 RepID=UPI001164CE05|nr:HD domain-containing protein [Altererythrobacter sp. TH136]QDM40810.1 HD domain-containing protein [Altererythrobacter sp. TH136]
MNSSNNKESLGQQFDEALVYASDAHRAQRRKGSRTPYVAHLLGVCSIALELGADQEQAIAALLHDAVEDQGGSDRLADIRLRFGEDVATIVAHCTDGEPNADRSGRENWRPRKEAYIASLSEKPQRSLLVSLADKTHNARAICDDLDNLGNVVFDRFTGEKAGTLWYYAALAEEFERLLPGIGADRLKAAVKQMHHLSEEGL